MTRSSSDNSDARVPLREWIESETKRKDARQNASFDETKDTEEWILCKTTVAFGITELLIHSRDNSCTEPPSTMCSIDNFSVRIRVEKAAADVQFSQPTWEGIKGVDMISPQLPSNIVEPSFLRSSFLDNGKDVDQEVDEIEIKDLRDHKIRSVALMCSLRRGRYLDVEFPTLLDVDGPPSIENQVEEDALCHLLGVLLHELFSTSHLGEAKQSNKEDRFESESKTNDDTPHEPVRKKTRLLDSTPIATQPSKSRQQQQQPPPQQQQQKPPPQQQQQQQQQQGQLTPFSSIQDKPHFPLTELGLPASISMLVQNLIECGCGIANRPRNAYNCLETVSNDLRLLLLDPSYFLFLFDHEPISENGGMPLLFRKHKLYGRENEASSITDAFCRVSSGKSEALFIGGFSGVGKSELVDSLNAQLDVCGGYILTHKFDQMLKERPFLEVISMFNDLCLLIKKKHAQQYLFTIYEELMDVFGTDFSVLARLLPNVDALSPHRNNTNHKIDIENHMDLQSICSTLRRFMGVVSSKLHPVLIFFDDLQWCHHSALTLIESILFEITRSSCILFIGSYRSNQIREDDSIFPLIDRLRFCGVPTTKLSLEGLNQQDLNAMVSDALCIFPRVCEPLSAIVYQKTKGNPFFVLKFLKLLVDGSLLEYSAEQKRWVWDEDEISSMDVTSNVLYLLSSKISSLPETAQLALKVMACFGAKINQSVIGYMSTNPGYSDIQSGLDYVAMEGFVTKVGDSDFKFIHNKIREAAYSLIPDSEKNKYHHNLGMSLYPMAKESNTDTIIFSIADQINHALVQSPKLRLDLARFYEMAGVRARDCSDYATARSYFKIASLLLPTDHWEIQYEQSLRLFFLLGNATYSCGDGGNAQDILRTILGECHCIDDKLPAYFLLVTILNASGENIDAYTTCREVLSQIYETIPYSLESKQTAQMIIATSKMIKGLSYTELLKMKEMNKKFSTISGFYSLMSTVALFVKPEAFAFLACRQVHLTMKHGISKWSILGFVQYAAATICSIKTEMNIRGASRVAENAMSYFKERFYSAEQLSNVYFAYFGMVAFHTEPLQSAAAMLRQGFETGMSAGCRSSALLNGIQHIKLSLISGEKLTVLLDKVDDYLELADLYEHELGKTYLSTFRDTISLFIDKGESASSKTKPNNAPTENSTKQTIISETLYFHRAMQAFWLGHTERCQHFVGKVLQLSYVESLSRMISTFIHGLNSCQMPKIQNTTKLRTVLDNAITSLKIAALHSPWNFQNKVYLLEAEKFSFDGNLEEANASYVAAIASARSSKFVHEQGLACECAGFHYKKIGDRGSARHFFNQAKQCYVEWGSQTKVGIIDRQLEICQIVR